MKIGVPLKLVLVASGILMNSEALAGEIEYEFTGTVNLVWGTSLYGISPVKGLPVVGRFSYNSSVPDTTPNDGVHYYIEADPNEFSFTLAGLTFASHEGFTITVQNSGYDSIQMFPAQQVVDVNGVSQFCNGFELLLDDITGRALSSARLPVTWDLSRLTTAQGEIWGLSGGATFTIESLSVIPEASTSVPDRSSTVGLLGLSIAVMFGLARIRGESPIFARHTNRRIFDF
jgi:hypothetical protein